MLHKLQYISQGKTVKEHHENIGSVLDSGATLVQLRLKNISDEEYIDAAHKAKETCEKYGASLIINDNVKVSKAVNSYALHLGLNDTAVEDARKIVLEKVIGGTANTFEHIKQRYNEKVNYIGLGPFRFTSTKEKLRPILGLIGYQNILKQMLTQGITVPVYAIGGIEAKDLTELMLTGVHGIAVSGMLTNASNKEKLIKELNKQLYNA
jgi:thiamine-phosphate pyrophosphorylase